MATLAAVISEIAADLCVLTGIRGAPANPPDQINAFPFIVTYARSGVIEAGPVALRRGLHNIVIELHVARRDLARDVAAAMEYADTVPNALLATLSYSGDRFNNTVSTFERITYTFGPMQWGGIDTIGFRWTLENVKIQDQITT